MRHQDPFYFAPQRKPCGGWVCYKDSPSPPPAPDYTGAANATSQGSVQAALVNALMNMRNTNTPLGKQTFTQNGTTSIPGIGGQPGFDIPKYDQNIDMSPEGKTLYDQQMRLSQGVGDFTEGQLGRLGDSVSKPFDYSNVPGRVTSVGADPLQKSVGPTDLNQARDATTNAIIQRQQPLMDRSRSMLRTQLANQGLAPGGEAYKNAQDDLSRQENDFKLGAVGAGNAEQNQLFGQGLQQGQFANTAQQQQFGQGMQNAGLMNQGRETGIQEQSYLRNLPLSEFNSFRTGAQPQMPQFQSVPAAGGAQGPNMLGAAGMQNQYDMGLYNSQVGQNNSMTSGLMSLAGTAAAFM